MPNDAKLGLVVGVSLVIAIGVIFYRKEPPAPSAAASPAGALAAPQRPAPAKAASLTKPAQEEEKP